MKKTKLIWLESVMRDSQLTHIARILGDMAIGITCDIYAFNLSSRKVKFYFFCSHANCEWEHANNE